jgi:hypothetical protein
VYRHRPDLLRDTRRDSNQKPILGIITFFEELLRDMSGRVVPVGACCSPA